MPRSSFELALFASDANLLGLHMLTSQLKAKKKTFTRINVSLLKCLNNSILKQFKLIIVILTTSELRKGSPQIWRGGGLV